MLQERVERIRRHHQESDAIPETASWHANLMLPFPGLLATQKA